MIAVWLIGSLFFFVTPTLEAVRDSYSIVASDFVQACPHVVACLLLIGVGGAHGAATREFCRLVSDPLMVILFVACIVSGVLGYAPATSLCLVVAFFLLFFVARMCITMGTDQEILRALAVMSICCTSATILLLCLPWEIPRYNRMLANHGFGEVSMLGSCLSFAIAATWLRWLVFALGTAGILIVESRAALLGLAAGVFAVWCLPSLRTLLRMGTVLLLVGCFVLSVPSWRHSAVSLLDSVLSLHCKDRGLGTGFTGRIDTWERGLREIRENPVFGTGPRTQEMLAHSADVKNVHNAYLLTILEVGFVGGLAFLAVFVRRLHWNRLARNNTHLNRVLLTATVAFLASIFFRAMTFSHITPALLCVVVWLELGRPAARVSTHRFPTAAGSPGHGH